MTSLNCVHESYPFEREAGAFGDAEITGFTVLREQDRYWYYRVTSNAGNVPQVPHFSDLGFGFCLEKALEQPGLHKVSTYNISASDEARFIFEKRSPYPNNPSSPPTIPTGSNWGVTWYKFRAIPRGYFDLIVAGTNFTYSVSLGVSWSDLEMLLTAMNDVVHYRLVIDGDPATGRPILKIDRLIR